ncbi:MAG: hemolysin III family protein [Saprospiraceae bacterium]|nr:hemolysin III family protein [Saprospiraceae bacterium]
MITFFPNKIPEHLKVDIKSIREERANMISHGVGLLLFLIGVPFLLFYTIKTGKFPYIIGAFLYGISLIMVYTSSTLYHSSYNATIRKRLRIFDHVSIYFLIAGSYSPFILTHVTTTIGWSIFIILWSMVLIGSVVKLWFVDKFQLISTIAYLVMGWMALFIIKPLYLELPLVSFYWLVIGGVLYTVGAFFYMREKMIYNHLVWHLFVLGGSIAHFIAVWYCLH